MPKIILLCALFGALAFAQSQSPVTVIKQTVPEKALIFEVVVPATPDQVWEAFTTSKGLSTWLTPGAVVSLREGGEWTAHFPGGKTGGGTIVSFVPGRELTLAALAPEQFPTVRAARTKARFEFIPKSSETLVRMTQTGWREGPEWEKAYAYLAAGNVDLLETLHERFVSGPIDWAKVWGTQAAPPK